MQLKSGRYDTSDTSDRKSVDLGFFNRDSGRRIITGSATPHSQSPLLVRSKISWAYPGSTAMGHYRTNGGMISVSQPAETLSWICAAQRVQSFLQHLLVRRLA